MGWSGGTFTRTNGVFSGASVWLSDKNAGTKIITSNHDFHDYDLAQGINATLTKDGTNSPSANLPMAGFRHTGVGTAQSTDQYAAASQVANNSMQWCGTATSTAGTMFSISNTFSGTSLTIGQRFQFIGTQASTASTYISVAGAGSALLCPADGTSALATGGVGSGELVDIAYSNLAGGIFQKLNAKTTEVVNTITVGSGGTLSGTYAGNPIFSGTVSVSGSGFVGTLGFNTATGSSVTGTTASFSGSANVGTIGGTRAAFSGSVSVGTLGVSGSASVTGGLSAGTLVGTFAGNPTLSGTVTVQSLIVNSGSLIASVKKQVLTSSGTYVPSASLAYADVEMGGGGGGGGGTSAANRGCGGGGAGAYARFILTGAQVGTGLVTTIAAAGTGNGFGGTTILAGVATCTGGQPGANNNATTNAGGTGGVATVSVGTGVVTRTGGQGSYGCNTSLVIGGLGGLSPLGAPGAMQAGPDTSFTSNGLSAIGYAAGGGGACQSSTAGTGAPGIIIVTEYCTA